MQTWRTKTKFQNTFKWQMNMKSLLYHHLLLSSRSWQDLLWLRKEWNGITSASITAMTYSTCSLGLWQISILEQSSQRCLWKTPMDRGLKQATLLRNRFMRADFWSSILMRTLKEARASSSSKTRWSKIDTKSCWNLLTQTSRWSKHSHLPIS